MIFVIDVSFYQLTWKQHGIGILLMWFGCFYTFWFIVGGVNSMLNKNSLAVKKCEANQ